MLARAPAALVVSLLVVRLVDETAAFLPAGALEQFRADLHLTYAQAGAVLVIYAGVPSAPIGIAADHVSRRVLASAGAFGHGAGLLLFAASHSFWQVALAVALMGFAADALVTGCEVALADLAADDLRAALAIQNVLAAIGDMLGPAILATALATGLGWRAAFVAGAALLFAYGGVLASQPIPRATRAPDEPRASVLTVLRDRRVLLLALGLLLVSLFDEPLAGFAIAYLGGDAAATLIVGAMTVGGLAGAIAVLRWRIAPRAAAMAIPAGLVTFLAVPAWPVQAFAMAVVGASGYVVWIDIQAALLTAHPGRAGTAAAVADTLSTPGLAFPLLIGTVADRAGLGAALWLYVLAAIVLVVCAP